MHITELHLNPQLFAHQYSPKQILLSFVVFCQLPLKVYNYCTTTFLFTIIYQNQVLTLLLFLVSFILLLWLTVWVRKGEKSLDFLFYGLTVTRLTFFGSAVLCYFFLRLDSFYFFILLIHHYVLIAKISWINKWILGAWSKKKKKKKSHGESQRKYMNNPQEGPGFSKKDSDFPLIKTFIYSVMFFQRSLCQQQSYLTVVFGVCHLVFARKTGSHSPGPLLIVFPVPDVWGLIWRIRRSNKSLNLRRLQFMFICLFNIPHSPPHHMWHHGKLCRVQDYRGKCCVVHTILRVHRDTSG